MRQPGHSPAGGLSTTLDPSLQPQAAQAMAPHAPSCPSEPPSFLSSVWWARSTVLPPSDCWPPEPSVVLFFRAVILCDPQGPIRSPVSLVPTPGLTQSPGPLCPGWVARSSPGGSGPTDNHDIISLKLFQLMVEHTPDEENIDWTKIEPSVNFLRSPKGAHQPPACPSLALSAWASCPRRCGHLALLLACSVLGHGGAGRMPVGTRQGPGPGSSGMATTASQQ